MTWMTVFAGALLGVLSRIEETSGWPVALSTNATWLATAFAAGALHRRCAAARATLAGSATLTAANLAYYATVALAEPGVDLTKVAGPPARWIALGVAGGAVLAAAGWLWARTRGPARVAAALPLSGVWVAQYVGALTGGALRDRLGLAAGAALLVASGRRARERVLGAAVAASVVAVALTGRLDALLP
jgi:hypothetical protein